MGERICGLGRAPAGASPDVPVWGPENTETPHESRANSEFGMNRIDDSLDPNSRQVNACSKGPDGPRFSRDVR